MKHKQVKTIFIFSTIMSVLCVAICSLKFSQVTTKDAAKVEIKEINHEQGIMPKITTSIGDIIIRVFEIDVSSSLQFCAWLSFSYNKIDNKQVKKMEMATFQASKELAYWKVRIYLILTSDGRYGISLKKPIGNLTENDIDYFCKGRFPINVEPYNSLFLSKNQNLPLKSLWGLPLGTGTTVVCNVNSNDDFYAAIDFNIEGSNIEVSSRRFNAEKIVTTDVRPILSEQKTMESEVNLDGK